MKELLHIYEIEKTCLYREEMYHVRDNGSVFRCKRPNKRRRPLDEQWTFGNPNKVNGYMNIAKETVHRIVATAFHGIQPTDKHVVDHIDTNKRNNRPENLRWITRLENILLNPITTKRIVYCYGSIDNFFNDPSNPIHKIEDKNFEWMRTVSKEEAISSKKRLMKWAKEGTVSQGGELGEWIFNQERETYEIQEDQDKVVKSLTPCAIQINWNTPNHFPNCPKSINSEPLITYRKNLKKGGPFAKNKYGTSWTEEAELNKNSDELLVLTESNNPIKPFALVKIYIINESIAHESLGTFFTKNGALKELNLSIGRDWDGEETIDDYSR